MRTILAVIASAGLVGCVGSIDTPPGSSNKDPIADPTTGNDGNDNGDNPSGSDLSAAKALFDANVFSAIKAKCSGGACHSETAQGATLTRFVSDDAARGWQVAVGYTALVGNFTTTAAPILTLLANTHKGMSWTPTEKDNIAAWLSKELELRNGQTPTTPGQPNPSQVADTLVSQFAGCMKLADFQAANMAGAWAKLQSNEGQCEQCHGNGGEGFIANNDPAVAFPIVSTKKAFWLQYFTVDLSKGIAMVKVVSNTVSFAGVCNRQTPHIAHPTFPCTNNAGVTALTNFYTKTMANVAAGGCAPKPLENF
jgi:hypothetical protein